MKPINASKLLLVLRMGITVYVLFFQTSKPDGPSLKVVHLHYTIWPDHGVPMNAVSLINFAKKVRKEHLVTHPSPLLVHCSAGVGRTGSFVVLDVMLQRMKEEGTLNIYEFISQLRTQRVFMVQTVVRLVLKENRVFA